MLYEFAWNRHAKLGTVCAGGCGEGRGEAVPRRRGGDWQRRSEVLKRRATSLLFLPPESPRQRLGGAVRKTKEKKTQSE